MSEPFVLGIEFGGTKLQLGLGHGDGRILALERRIVEPRGGAEGILAQVVDAIGPLCRRIELAPERISAVGIGFGGPVDTASGTITKSYQIEGWDGFPLADWVRRV